jgi:tetratricopeptide (TPR) repeat protein
MRKVFHFLSPPGPAAFLFISVFVVLALPLAAQEHEHRPAPGASTRVGTVEFANTCDPAVQQQLQTAVAMLHSFWYAESARAFRETAQKDPDCAVAWWGVAMTYWHPLWEPQGPNAEAMQKGQAAIQKAATAAMRSQREKDFVAALESFYRDYDKSDHAQRVLVYEKAMERLYSHYPGDTEAAAFYALSLLGSATSLPPDKTYARQKRAGALLQPILAKQPDHPGVAHYIIHAYDYPTLAAEGLEAARSYTKIAPDSPHALHMPSHIFTRLGLWQESIESNLASAAAARKHNEVGEELHATDYLVFAYLQTAQDDKAQALGQNLKIAPEDDSGYFAGLYARAAIPGRYAIERRQWAEAAALPDPENFPGGRYAWAEATVYFARALGSSRTGKLEQAREDLERLASSRQALLEHHEDYWARQVEIQSRSAGAWLALAEGDTDKALARMRSAVELEDTADKHPVTPGYVAPARHLLGEMLLELKQPKEALATYEELLASEPNRFVALYGAARAAELAGDSDKAAQHYAKLLEICHGQEQQRAELRQAQAYLARSGNRASE